MKGKVNFKLYVTNWDINNHIHILPNISNKDKDK